MTGIVARNHWRTVLAESPAPAKVSNIRATPSSPMPPDVALTLTCDRCGARRLLARHPAQRACGLRCFVVHGGACPVSMHDVHLAAFE
jgi:hypothetical protein